MSWNARISLLGGAIALGLILIAFWTTKAYGATLIGFASGVALCAFWPQIEGWIRGVFTEFSPSKLGALVFGAREPTDYPSFAAFFGKFARGVANILGFLLTHWRRIVLILLAVAIIGGLRACSAPFGFDLGKNRGVILLERELAEAEARTQEAVNARDAIIAQAAQQAAVHRAQIELLSEQGRLAIEAATPEHETPIDPELERAFLSSLERLYANAGLDPHSPNPGGPRS